MVWHNLSMEKDRDDKAESNGSNSPAPTDREEPSNDDDKPRPKEIGGRGGLDPTRYGDWEKAGRCIDF